MSHFGRDRTLNLEAAVSKPSSVVHLLTARSRRAGTTPTALEELYRAHVVFVATLAYKVLGRDDEIDDIVQDVFMAALRGIAALRDPSAVRPWLGSVTVRVVRRRLRLLRLRRWWGLLDAPEYESVAAPGATPEDRATLARIYTILDELPVDQRVAWCLRHVEGYELAAVAGACECSLATAKRRIAAAHAAVTEEFSDA
jgi:RNA polymerase sigma-70 factor (ECF subfamily)